MPRKTNVSNGTAGAKTETETDKAKRDRVDLPTSIERMEVAWPGQARNTANAPLRQQLVEDVGAMEYGSVRHYSIGGDREQAAFLSLFRSVVHSVYGDQYGVQAVRQENAVIVRLHDPVKRTRKAKTAPSENAAEMADAQ